MYEIIEWPRLAEGASTIISSRSTMATPKMDIWDDAATMAFLRTGRFADDASRKEKSRIRNRARRHVFENECLYLREGRRQIPQPKQRTKLIRRVHTEQLAHAKKRAVLDFLRNHYFWAGMEADVQMVLLACTTCAKTTPRFLAPPPTLKQQTADRLFQCWGTDLVTLDTKGQGPYIITCEDYFSRWAEVGVLANKKAQTTWNWFQRKIIDRYGPPEIVISDNGGEFLSHFTENLRKQGTDHRRITPGRPQANGLCERFNGTIQKRIKSLQADEGYAPEKAPWEQLKKLVSSAVRAYRWTKHSAIERSPFEVVFGQRPYIVPPEDPEDQEEEPATQDLEDLEERTEPASPAAVQQRMTKLAQIRREAAASDQRRREREQKRYQKKRKPGSEVPVPLQIYRKNPAKRRKKDASVIGPYRVLACSIEKDRFLIQPLDSQSESEWVRREECAECEQTF